MTTFQIGLLAAAVYLMVLYAVILFVRGAAPAEETEKWLEEAAANIQWPPGH